jgi:hypothetical protein
MTTVLYPPDKAVKVAKKFIEATTKPLPPFMKRLYVFTTARTDLGMKTCGIYEVDDAKLKEGIIELTKYFVQFYDIEGFKYEVEPMLTAQEAIPLLGIKMP